MSHVGFGAVRFCLILDTYIGDGLTLAQVLFAITEYVFLEGSGRQQRLESRSDLKLGKKHLPFKFGVKKCQDLRGWPNTPTQFYTLNPTPLPPPIPLPLSEVKFKCLAKELSNRYQAEFYFIHRYLWTGTFATI